MAGVVLYERPVVLCVSLNAALFISVDNAIIAV